MRVIILAGGYAKRLWPLTLERPKSLLPLGDGYILDYIISKIMKMDKLSEIVISTNKKFEINFSGSCHCAIGGRNKPKAPAC
ncbi:MAG: sugar phosphate nucleotidyltransferase [Candidatus Methanomethyliaceae archaeon]